MPVPIFSTRVDDRPSGLVPPAPDLAGVTELRVHGVGGTTPGALLGDLAPEQVAGDSVAGFYRTADVRGRHVEAYSWGGLTSRSGTRVLWLLLLPFMLANLAGWMGSRRAAASGRYRWLMRCGALALTLNLLLVTAMISVDVLGYQCGSRPRCTAGRWWLAPLRWSPLAGHPARLVVVGALLPALVLLVLAFLSYRSRERYEAVRPPGTDKPRDPHSRSAAALPGGLADAAFWDGARATKRLGRAHTAAALALLTVLVLHCTGSLLEQTGAPVRLDGLRVALQLAAVLVLAAAVVVLAAEELPDWAGAVLLGVAEATALSAAVLAWVQPAMPGAPAGQLPGIRAVINWTYGGVFLVLAVILVAVPWIGRGRAGLRGREPMSAHTGRVPAGGRQLDDRGSFRWGAPFVVLAVAVALLNTVLLGVLIRVADLAGDVVWTIGGGTSDGPGTPISVFPAVRAAAPYLTLIPVAVAVLFCLVEAARYLVVRLRAKWSGDSGIEDEYTTIEQAEQAQLDERADRAERARLAGWQESALPAAESPTGQAARRLWRRGRVWRGRLAGARRLAAAGTDVSYLLTVTVAVGVVVLGLAEYQIWSAGRMPPGGPLFLTLGTTAAAALPLLLLGALRSGWRSLTGRRRIGVLWDIGTFWPRSFHPLAPPSYAERAVPELQRRLWWLHDRHGEVLLAAHSQGSVLAAAALLQPTARPAGSRLALVTFGCPLGKLYRWGFPAYVNDDVLATLLRPPGDGSLPWVNVYYDTDYIGAAVFRHPRGDVDQRLPDPRTSSYRYGQPLPPIGGHSGYWTDPEMWRRIDVLAGELARSAHPPATRGP